MYHANVNVNLTVENVIQTKSGIMINVDARNKKHWVHEKYYIWNPATCSCENGKYLASIIYDLVITCDEIIDSESNLYDEETKKKQSQQIVMKKK